MAAAAVGTIAPAGGAAWLAAGRVAVLPSVLRGGVALGLVLAVAWPRVGAALGARGFAVAAAAGVAACTALGLVGAVGSFAGSLARPFAGSAIVAVGCCALSAASATRAVARGSGAACGVEPADAHQTPPAAAITIAAAAAQIGRARARRSVCARGTGSSLDANTEAPSSPSSICATVFCHELALARRARCGTGSCPASAASNSATFCGRSCGAGASIQSHACSNRSGTPPCPEPANRGCSSLTARAVAGTGALPVMT